MNVYPLFEAFVGAYLRPLSSERSIAEVRAAVFSLPIDKESTSAKQGKSTRKENIIAFTEDKVQKLKDPLPTDKQTTCK